MNKDLEIDNVQSFAEVIGDNDNLWNLLIEREVISFWGTLGRVVLLCDRGKGSEIRVDLTVWVIDHVGAKDYTRCKFFKIKEFINEFNKINPPFYYEDIFKLIQAQKREVQRQETEKWEAKKRELERQETEKLKVEKLKAEKQTLFKNLKDYFEYNFLNVDNFYHAQCREHITFQEYQSQKSNYVQSWVKTNLNTSPDLEQAAAIGAVEQHIQVVARAGSGKTSTLVNRTLFLQKHCGVAPHKMLLLAFNREAAKEIKERLTSQLQDSIPHVMTFHALAYALVHPEESILFDEPDGQQSKSRTLQKVIDGYLQDPCIYEKIRVLMMAHFREDWGRLISGGYDKSPEEMLHYRRSLPKEGIDGTYLKSFGEKVIADFLFEHDIKYKYERNFWWDGINYRPDFTVGENQGLIIEYFGLEGDPDYDAMSEKKREYWEKNSHWRLLELSPKTLRNEGVEYFCASLKQDGNALKTVQ